jgi:LPS sulfotransferase NodH
MQLILDTLFALSAQLQQLMQQLDDDHYSQPTALLGNSSVGQHVRHSMEMLESLVQGYDAGVVNYDRRRRYQPWQTEVQTACLALDDLLLHLQKPDKLMQLEVSFHSAHSMLVHTSYWRELVYHTEHLIHHMALIRIQVNAWPQVHVHPHFGIAPSTLQYKQACAQ